jgi:hypothetical protein
MPQPGSPENEEDSEMKRTLMLIAFAVLIITLSISTPNLAAQAACTEI